MNRKNSVGGLYKPQYTIQQGVTSVVINILKQVCLIRSYSKAFSVPLNS